MFVNYYWNVSILIPPFGTERGRHHIVEMKNSKFKSMSSKVIELILITWLLIGVIFM
jgi:hypothetical protein